MARWIRAALAALASAALAAVPVAAADPIEFYPGPRTVLADTCAADPGLGVGLRVWYQPIYYGTYDPLPHADGVLITGGAETRAC